MEEIIAALRISTPFLLAALGELIIERSGVLNLGIEGVMTLGAFSAFITAYFTGNPLLGFLVSCAIGAAIGLLTHILLVDLGTNQHVTGLGITLLLTSLSYFLYRTIFSAPTAQPMVRGGNPTTITALAFFLYAIAYLVQRTKIGLILKACGDNAKALDRMGHDPFLVRKVALVLGNLLIGLGGSFLSIAQYNSFLFNIVGGRGWISLALVSMGGWNPLRTLVFGLTFGFLEMLQIRAQIWFNQLLFLYPLFLMIPYVATILLLCLTHRSSRSPRELLRPYKRE